MNARTESEATPMKNRTTVERKSERELVARDLSTFRNTSVEACLASRQSLLV